MFKIILISLLALIAAACADHPIINSGIATSNEIAIQITTESPVGRKYKAIDHIYVSVKQYTTFNAEPTKELVNEELVKKARIVGADAVINVVYKRGREFTNYMDGYGVAIKFLDH
jgi:uncharacterized protein YbjQ (UPF0145 family)